MHGASNWICVPIFAFRIKCMLIAYTFRIHFLELNTCSSRKLPNYACHFENSKFVANNPGCFLDCFCQKKSHVIIFLELPLAPRPYKPLYRNCDPSCAPDTFENCRNRSLEPQSFGGIDVFETFPWKSFHEHWRCLFLWREHGEHDRENERFMRAFWTRCW